MYVFIILVDISGGMLIEFSEIWRADLNILTPSQTLPSQSLTPFAIVYSLTFPI